MEKFPALRSSIISKLLETLGDVKSGKVFRGALWIIGEYCAEVEGLSSYMAFPWSFKIPNLTFRFVLFRFVLLIDIDAAFKAIRKVVGEVPILASEQVRWIHSKMCSLGLPFLSTASSG